MEAVPRLPMLSFELKVSPENAQFGPQLKQYIATFYNEDPDSYDTEISNLESLRAAAVRPTVDVSGCQLLKKYYCQLHFLKSRFPMHEMQAAAVYFLWKDTYSNMPGGVSDIRFEMMCILYNIGALHSQLGSSDLRTSPDGMKMACTHFQCAAWAFQTVKETYHEMVPYVSSIEVVHFMQQVCLAQAQECILEKSMMDNRKATIIAKVAVQVVDYYKRSLGMLQANTDDSSFLDLVGSRTYKEWVKYLSFKISYHKSVALLFQGQQAEEQQKMGERVAFYQAACEQLEDARKLSASLKQQKDIGEALGFTSDVVEGKRKAAKNENEFIYHEEVPEKHALQEVKGASLVKGIPFSVTDPEVSGPDIFGRLVPMEAHEASSLYSEKKAQMLRQLGELVESKDQALAEFMSSLQLDVFQQMRQATGLSQDLIDRAAALSAKPRASQELIQAMGKLSNSYHDVEAMLGEIQELLQEEERNEQEYQDMMGKRPPSIIATDLSREANKYREAHSKANDSNQNLHKAMTTHVANLKILAQPLAELQKQIPSVEIPHPNVDEACIRDIEKLIAKVEEMRAQRSMLWSQLREAVHIDDITGVLVTRQPDQPLDQLFQKELEKHREIANLIEQNSAAQEKILEALVDTYARSTPTRRFLQEIIGKRNSTMSALISSCDSYEDLLAKANKGLEFYNKLETNVSKLLQRIKSASKVQQEEREQILMKNCPPKEEPAVAPIPSPSLPHKMNNTAPKLKDYLDSRKKSNAAVSNQQPPQQYYQPPENLWPTSVRPAPLGSEINVDAKLPTPQEPEMAKIPGYQSYDPKLYAAAYQSVAPEVPYGNYTYQADVDQNLGQRMANLQMGYSQGYTDLSYVPNNYPSASSVPINQPQNPQNSGSKASALTATTDTYQPISSHSQNPQNIQNNLNYAQVPAVPGVDNYAYYPQQQVNLPPNYGYPAAASTGAYSSYNYAPPSTPSPALPAQQVSNVSNVEVAPSPSGYGSSDQCYYSYGYVAPSSDGYNYGYAAPSTPQATPTDSPSSYSYNTNNVPVVASVSSNAQGNYSYTQPYASYAGYNNYGYNYAPQPEIPASENSTPQPSGKQSNVDLLSGLDFNVSQAPLIPQQKPSIEEIKKPATSANKTETPSPRTPSKNDAESNNATPEKTVHRKPLNNSEVKKLIGGELEKFEKFVEVLNNKTLNGPTNLELKWKEHQDKQEAEKKTISVARCYPMKNRFPDILPYDHSRVELKGTVNDYINASLVKDISYYAAPLIVTQAPISSTISDFWLMIREQQVELIVCLQGDSELGGDIYWPREKGRHLHYSGMVVSLMGHTVKPHWTERLISISTPDKRESRVVVHLQYTAWPGSLFPTSPDNFTSFVIEAANLFIQQRNTGHPMVVHCSAGIGRSGVFSLLLTTILEMSSNPVGVPDLVALAGKLAASRRNILRDREHFKFAYECLLCYMKQIVSPDQAKRGLNEQMVSAAVAAASNGLDEKRTEIQSEIDEKKDPLGSLDPFWINNK